jgi:phosphoribosyl 1,2-cyclic phosphodiesterase
VALSISSLNSGSNGNCFYIGNGSEAVLIDAGISCRETERRMSRLGLDMKTVKAVFISHEHSDHIKGVEVLSKKYRLPVYITPLTLSYSGLKLDESLVSRFRSYEPVQVGGLSVTAFPKLHDASDPHSFIVEGNGTRIGVFTDIGAPCHHVIQNFKTCDAAFLEANYDEEMLEQGRYPYYLKRRIASDKGHLSNRQALDLFTRHKPQGMSHLLLSHLSKDNNCPELAGRLFTESAGSTFVTVASRYKETEVYRITKDPSHKSNTRSFAIEPEQLSLF